MCLYIHNQKTKPKPQIAAKDIVLWKGFEVPLKQRGKKRRRFVTSPVFYTDWRFGEIKTVENRRHRHMKQMVPVKSHCYLRTYLINEGLHSCADRKGCRWGKIVCKVVIPKGTPYFVSGNDFVSTMLKLLPLNKQPLRVRNLFA